MQNYIEENSHTQKKNFNDMNLCHHECYTVLVVNIWHLERKVWKLDR